MTDYPSDLTHRRLHSPQEFPRLFKPGVGRLWRSPSRYRDLPVEIRQSIIERLTAAEASRQRADRAVREAYEAQRVEVGARVRSDALLRAEGPLIPALLERAGDVLRPLCEALERENTQLAAIRQALDACDARLARLEARPEVRAIRRHEENQYKTAAEIKTVM